MSNENSDSSSTPRPSRAGKPPPANVGTPGGLPRRRRRWLRITALAVVLVLLGVLATPFLFTGALVRYLIAQSAYRNVPLRFRSASLSPWGALTVHGVVIEEQGKLMGKPLVAAEAVRVTFDWGNVRAGRVRSIRVENIDATLRPDEGTALTLLRLLPPKEASATTAPAAGTVSQAAAASQALATSPPGATWQIAASAPATAPATTPSGGNAFWFDELVVSGTIHVEGYGPWQEMSQIHATDALPLRLVVTSSGTAAAPSRDFSLTVGEPDVPAHPALVSHFRLTPTGAGTALVIDSLALSNVYGKSTLLADARYGTTTGTWETANARLRAFEAGDVKGTLPAGIAATGRVEGDFHYAASAAGGNLEATLTPAAPLAVTVPEGSLTLDGSPEVSLRAAYDPAARVLRVDAFTLHGINALRADAGFVKHFAAAGTGGAGDAGQNVWKMLEQGAFLAVGDLSLNGRVDLQNAAGPPEFMGIVNMKGVSAGKSPDALIVENAAFATVAVVPLSPSPDFTALRVAEGKISADKITAGKNVVSQFSAAVAAEQGRLNVTQMALAFADGTGKGDAALTLPAQLDSLRLEFTHIDQNILTQALYPSAFTAEGHISAKLSLMRTPGAPLAGSIDLTSEEPGRLKISRETSAQSFGQAAKAVAAVPGTMLPPNFDEITVGQLANYPYERGHLVVQDKAGGLLLKFDYKRAALTPGEPGYGISTTVGGQKLSANFPVNLNNEIGMKQSVMDILQQLVGLRDSVLAPTSRPAPVSRPASAPSPAATKPATTKS